MKLGVTLTATGADIAVWAPAADEVWFCRALPDGSEDRTRLTTFEGGVWSGSVHGVAAGTRYGLRTSGELLVDPYATLLDGPMRAGQPAPYAVVLEPHEAPAWTPPEELVIYEAHVKGLTALRSDVPEELRGTYAGAALMAPYLAELGVTALELLPIQAFVDDAHVVTRGLTNYWGYQPIAWHAPEPRYASSSADREVRELVEAMHAHDIAVIVDVVYNHTGEGGHDGIVLSLKGLAPQAYRMAGDEYVNDAGTGNTVAADEPMMLKLILDSLRHWATRYGIDGFRFDLAATLGRTAHGFDARAAFLQAIGQDPLLSRLILIAEPWDIGPGGYQLGAFPHPWHEWNDRFRDDVRRAWRGDPLMLRALAARLLGSAAEFDHYGRTAHSSINFITAHDGFTLADLVSYEHTHNLDNGEDGRDGHSENYSSNGGVEGPSSSPAVLALREKRMRGMIATLALAQGVPMLLAGDEAGNSQGGNNNAYAQDNEVGWVSWGTSLPFAREALAARGRMPVLRQRPFLHGDDVVWRRADGADVSDGDWQDPSFRTVVAVMRREVILVINLGDQATVELPEGTWRSELDSSGEARLDGTTIEVPALTLVALSCTP